jgi:hypothetical protein
VGVVKVRCDIFQNAQLGTFIASVLNVRVKCEKFGAFWMVSRKRMLTSTTEVLKFARAGILL